VVATGCGAVKRAAGGRMAETSGSAVARGGRILAMEDMAGLTPRVPAFAERHGDPGAPLAVANRADADDVRARRFCSGARRRPEARPSRGHGGAGAIG
jgi:hypothetical protein